MRPSSCKAKGRRLALEVRESLLQAFPDLQPEDVRVTSSGAPGEDLLLSPAAFDRLPLAVECKNVEALNLWAALEQASNHARLRIGSLPAVIFRRNRTEPHITLRLIDFLALMGRRDQTKETAES